MYPEIQCMVTAGLISQEEGERLSKIWANLPFSEGGLLAIIAASLINNGNNINFSDPISTESVSSTGLADVQSLTIPEGATKAVVTPYGNNIIYRIDGNDPAADSGHYLQVGINYIINDLSDFRFVSEAGNATLFITFF